MLPQPFRSYASVLRERFGGAAYKVGLDARMTCPNIDGTVARGGCTFCTNPSFSFQPMNAAARRRDLREQLRIGMEFYKHRRGAERFIAYFQTFTNTYAPVSQLRAIYESVLEVEGVVGLAISTRPDCLGEPVLDLLEELSARTHLTIELGLQTANDRTLERINRGHTVGDFFDAMRRIERRRLKTKVHLLFGLPGEGVEDALRSVDAVNETCAEGVKLHHFQVLEGTALGREYRQAPFRLLGFEEYRGLIVEVIARLRPDLYVDRLFATCRSDLVLAPDYGVKPSELRRALLEGLQTTGTTQGCRYRGRSSSCSAPETGALSDQPRPLQSRVLK